MINSMQLLQYALHYRGVSNAQRFVNQSYISAMWPETTKHVPEAICMDGTQLTLSPALSF